MNSISLNSYETKSRVLFIVTKKNILRNNIHLHNKKNQHQKVVPLTGESDQADAPLGLFQSSNGLDLLRNSGRLCLPVTCLPFCSKGLPLSAFD